MEMTKRMETNVASIEKWVFYFLCGFALLSSQRRTYGNGTRWANSEV